MHRALAPIKFCWNFSHMFTCNIFLNLYCSIYIEECNQSRIITWSESKAEFGQSQPYGHIATDF